MDVVARSKPFADVVAELLSRSYQVRFRAEGASMSPTIRGGETITVEPASVVTIGDIALYRTKRGLIAHRIVGIRKQHGSAPVFLMRGEAMGSTEEVVQEQEVLGKVRAVERNGHSVDLGSRWARTRRRVRSLARDWALGGVHRGGVFLLLSAFVAVFPNAARASVGVTARAANAASSGNTCTVTGLNTTTATPNGLILVSISASNANSITSTLTLNPAGGTQTQLVVNLTSPDIAIWSITGFTSTTSLSITINMGGAAGGVCGAVAFSGVNPTLVGPAWTVTSGASASPSITGTAPGPGGVVFDTLSVTAATAPTATPGPGQVQQWNTPSGSIGRMGAASVAPPTTKMSWTLSASQTWIMGAVPLGPVSSTEVQLTSFTVTQKADRNLIELTTGREVSSLGFNLYREQNGARVRLNSSLLAGTALLAGSDTSLTAGRIHKWWDTPRNTSGVSYSVEEVDLRGQHTWYGPVSPEPAEPAPGRSAGSTALTTANVRDGAGQAALLTQVGQDVTALGTGVNAAPHGLQARAAPAKPQNTKILYALAAGQAVKLGVQSEGWYEVAGADLLAAGFDPNADVSTLRLYAEGVEQPIVVQGQGVHTLGPQGTIQFYGTGLDTTWSDTRVYWLTWGTGRGLRMQAETNNPGAAGPSNFPFTVEWRPRTLYFAALLNGDADNFFGPVLASGGPVSQPISIVHLDPNATDAAQLRVALQGVSLTSHSVAVALNGNSVGTVSFTNQTAGVVTLPVPVTMLQEGQNLLTLTVLGGDADVTVVDNVDLSYPHTFTADNDSLRFTTPGGEAETIGGFSNKQVLVVDITDPAAVTVVPGTITPQAGGFGVTIVPQGGGPRTLLALTTAQEAQPATISAHHPSSWHAAQPGFDLVMISHASFVQSLGPLVTLHAAEGRTVAVIDVEDLYDEFNFGEKTPYALKDFLSTAQAQWRLKPRFVLLAGDATFDPRNYLQTGAPDLVPTYLVGTTQLETASDDWFADFSGQGLPQMAIGRLPVRTAQDAAALVSKIVTYQQSGPAGWKKQVLLVADQNDGENDFQGQAAAVQALLPPDLSVSEIIFQGGANTALLSALNVEGAAIVNYTGHGSELTWANGLFSSTDAAGLTNGAMVPFVISMTCLNGYFQDVFDTALAKALIEAPGGGALAVWASSGLTDSGAQAPLNQALIKALFGAKSVTIGEAAAKAKAAVSDLDVRRTWILFGDPALRLQK